MDKGEPCLATMGNKEFHEYFKSQYEGLKAYQRQYNIKCGSSQQQCLIHFIIR
jgi:hypothetical protein